MIGQDLVNKETGKTSYIRNGNFELFDDYDDLLQKLRRDLS